ncbi:MAG: YchJ family protein [Cellulomonas sp.]
MRTTRCPCLSGETYDACCGVYHRGDDLPATAELLMRSRYSAFAVGDLEYLAQTWHTCTRPSDLSLDDSLRWYRLDILGATRGQAHDTEGTVEFRAFYRSADGPGRVDEVSSFVREAGGWVYLDAIG